MESLTSAAEASVPRSRRVALGSVGHHAGVLAAYAVVSAALTWPLTSEFTTQLVGHVYFDMRHAVWMMWYWGQALTGNVAGPFTTLLYHPFGISAFVDGVGPVNALLGAGFWPWGPAAAFNGAVLVGMILSGWCMYLLARHVGLDTGAGFFTGVLFVAWPIHLAGLYGHLEKSFTGLLPLTALAALLAFDVRRRWTAWLPAPVLLATLFQNGNQFVFAILTMAVLAILQLARTPRAAWRHQARRIAVVASLAMAVCAPALWAIVKGAYHPLIVVALGPVSSFYAPDLLQILVPSPHQALFAPWLYPGQVLEEGRASTSLIPALLRFELWYGSGIETSVNVPFTALVLAAVACWRAEGREARRWLVVGLVFAVLALGPYLRVHGQTHFTSAGFRVLLPGGALSKLPGFNVMRTPGRYMMMGSVGFALAAGFGLMAVARRRGAAGRVSALVLGGLVLAECWPSAWPLHAPPPVPPFYQQIAHDRARYAVLDLPAGWGNSATSSAYQYYQITHGKPIAWGYLSRAYTRYPVAGLESLWDPAVTADAATRARLAGLGYRYVVWHKHWPELLIGPREHGEGPPTGPPRKADTDAFLREAFRNELPAYEDALVIVFRLAP